MAHGNDKPIWFSTWYGAIIDVSHGGTAVSSFLNTNSLICSGSTTSGLVSLSNGVSGQVLKSNEIIYHHGVMKIQ